jgi:hypothetical protein
MQRALRLGSAVLISGVLAGPATAQQVTLGVARGSGVTFHRDPARPQQTTPVPAPAVAVNSGARPDLFRAGPDTYAPQYDHSVPLPYQPFFTGYAVAPPVYVRTEREVVLVREIVREVPAVAKQEPAAPSPPAAPAILAVKKTFYVIPGCYAGDRRPAASELRPGCDIRDVRVVPPR